MAARKLQAEIDRTLKRIDEGMLEFDAVYDRVNGAETQVQKEKYEEELKKETKKLQKYRDLLKLWATSPEIKNKQPLLDARRNIERKMEIFKAVERETKVKAYSREGLSRDTPMSAEERKRLKSREWIQDAVQNLNDQIDEFEAELESYEGSKNKREKELATHLDTSLKNHRWHIDHLEALMRMLDNATVEADDVDMIQDNIEDYIEHAREEDYEVDLELYDGFSGLTIGGDDSSDTSDIASDNENRTKSAGGAGKKEADLPKAPVATVPVTKATPPASTTAPSAKTPTAVTPGRQPTSAVEATAAGRGRAPLSASKADGIAQGAVKPSVTPAVTKPSPAGTTQLTTSAAPAAAPVPAGRGKAAAPTTVVPGPTQPAVVPIMRANSAPTPSSTATLSATTAATVPVSTPAAVPPRPADSLANIVRGKQGTTAPVTYASIANTGNTNAADAAAKTAQTPNPFAVDAATATAQVKEALAAANIPAPSPAVLENPLVPLPIATQRFNMAALQLSMAHIPEPLDCERPKPYVPRNPTTITHPSFPTTPAPALESPQLFERMDVDTLFFLFYYQQGTYLQYLAAKELKRHNWRFHKRYFVWFKRQEEPKQTTAEHEQGTYVYFDYEMGWLVRIKKDFVFDYAFLEDELV